MGTFVKHHNKNYNFWVFAYERHKIHTQRQTCRPRSGHHGAPGWITASKIMYVKKKFSNFVGFNAALQNKLQELYGNSLFLFYRRP
jgi:hypothetical protein